MWSVTLNLSLFAKNAKKIYSDKLNILKYPYGMMFVKLIPIFHQQYA